MFNNFIITGVPRSGTHLFCNKLQQFDDIEFAFRNEPFHHLLQGQLDVPNALNEIQTSVLLFSQVKADYAGLKTFPNYLMRFMDVVSINQAHVIPLIRRDIWKAFGSMYAGLSKHENLANKSSKPWKYVSVYNKMEEAYILSYTAKTLKNLYLFHSNWNNNIVYFEDLVNKQFSNNAVDDYFNREITFFEPYDDSHHCSEYFRDFDHVKDIVQSHVKSNYNAYKNLPDYALDNLLNV